MIPMQQRAQKIHVDSTTNRPSTIKPLGYLIHDGSSTGTSY
jgi:hypothetical protein